MQQKHAEDVVHHADFEAGGENVVPGLPRVGFPLHHLLGVCLLRSLVTRKLVEGVWLEGEENGLVLCCESGWRASYLALGRGNKTCRGICRQSLVVARQFSKYEEDLKISLCVLVLNPLDCLAMDSFHLPGDSRRVEKFEQASAVCFWQ
jgi:hypothetical protein